MGELGTPRTIMGYGTGGNISTGPRIHLLNQDFWEKLKKLRYF
jgi:hypothetical protein